ncbi:hydrolase [uncultured Methanolobus sp.]|uniref:hydrolase n=1 Tax=uncultured Methanolobus sp. TaxID=218300 RepID=UPI0029C95CA7|nr:hydrolase [uncultured Methanolobus sp.]
MDDSTGLESCCPEFNPSLWDNGNVWDKKPFIKDSVTQSFHIPLPFSFKRAVMRMWQKVQESDASPEMDDFLLLAYDPSPWKSELYLYVTKGVPDAENVTMSGTFLSRVFDGPYKSVPEWIETMEKYVSEKGMTVRKHYFHFAYCPKCAKKYGHNYAVAFTEVEEK